MGSSYRRATWLQVPLAIVSFLCGVVIWFQGGDLGWLIAAMLVGGVVPFTLVVVMPTNQQLLATGRDFSSTETRQLLVRWGRLHAFRTALSSMATVIYLWLLLRG